MEFRKITQKEHKIIFIIILGKTINQKKHVKYLNQIQRFLLKLKKYLK